MSDAIIALIFFFAAEVLQALFRDVKVRRLELQLSLLRKDAAAQRTLAAKLNTPATFAKAAKHERNAIVLEKQVEALQQQKAKLQGSWLNRVPAAVKMVVTLVLAWRWWGRPLVYLEPGTLWPFGRWLASPHAATLGHLSIITALPWLALCQRASRTVVAYFLME
eukprot:jgi/Botrbrau1/16890/Bobra.150_2s0103.1